MSKKNLFWSVFTIALVIVGVVQFVPAPRLLIPVELPASQREAHRLLNFEGIANFRDLGGYPTTSGQHLFQI